MKKFILVFVITLNLAVAQDKKEFNPIFHGFLKNWYQVDFSKSQGEFLVKMVRVGVKGEVNDYAGYRLLADFTKLGKLSTVEDTLGGKTVLKSVSANFSDLLLDAEAVLKYNNISASLGQFKIPFSNDNLKSDTDLDFINRSFITNVNPAARDIGVMFSYSFKDNIPLDIKAGVFNGTGPNKQENDKNINYSLRSIAKPFPGIEVSANYYAGKSTGNKISVFNLGMELKTGSFAAAGEYGRRATDLNKVKSASNCYYLYGCYAIPFEESLISNLVLALRYDSYDANLSVSNNGVERLTSGLTLQFAKVSFAQL